MAFAIKFVVPHNSLKSDFKYTIALRYFSFRLHHVSPIFNLNNSAYSFQSIQSLRVQNPYSHRESEIRPKLCQRASVYLLGSESRCVQGVLHHAPYTHTSAHTHRRTAPAQMSPLTPRDTPPTPSTVHRTSAATSPSDVD